MTKPIIRSSFREIASKARFMGLPAFPLVVHMDEIRESSDSLAEQPYCHKDFFGLNIVLSGDGTHRINDIPYAITQGDIYVMGIGATHVYSNCRQLKVQSLYFLPEIFDSPTLNSLADVPGFHGMFVEEPLNRAAGERWLRLMPNAFELVVEELSELWKEFRAVSPGGDVVVRSLFFRLLVHLARLYASSQAGQDRIALYEASPQELAIASAVRLMKLRFSDPITCEEIAASVFLSSSRLTALFRSSMDQTPLQFLIGLRIARAKELLESTSLSVTQIAGQSGFDEPSYFARAFRNATGLQPREYRKQYRHLGGGKR